MAEAGGITDYLSKVQSVAYPGLETFLPLKGRWLFFVTSAPRLLFAFAPPREACPIIVAYFIAFHFFLAERKEVSYEHSAVIFTRDFCISLPVLLHCHPSIG
jgi:hypothetical protein